MPRPRRPLLWLLGGYTAGLAAGRWLPIAPDTPWPTVLAALVVVTLGGLAWWWLEGLFGSGRSRAARTAGLVPPLVAVAAFGLGALALAAELRPRLPDHHVARIVEAAGGRLRATVEARVVNVERTRGSGVALLVEVEALETAGGRSPAVGRVLVRVERGAVAPPSPGDRLRFTASLRFPRTFRNPGGYDARARLALRAVRVVGVVRDYAEVTALPSGGLSARALPRTLVERLRDRVRGALEAAVRGPAAELLRALILGEEGDLPRELRDAFQATGTAHILSISGLHMGLVAAAAFAFARRAGGWLAPRLWPAADVRRGAALAALGPVLLYLGLAGAGTAAVRAALMAGAILVALALGRRLDLWSALALAALLVLAAFPGALFELSFLLSFGAVAAILRLSPWLGGLPGIRELLAPVPAGAGLLIRTLRRAGTWAAASLVVSAAAVLGTGPLLAATFGRVTPWSPVANLVVVPIAGGLAVGLGLAGAAVALVAPAAAAPLFQADAAILDFAIGAVEAVATWPGALVWVPAPGSWEVVAAYVGLWLLPAAWPLRGTPDAAGALPPAEPAVRGAPAAARPEDSTEAAAVDQLRGAASSATAAGSPPSGSGSASRGTPSRRAAPASRPACPAPPADWRRVVARVGVLAAAVLLVVTGVVRAWPPPAGTLRATFLDVGAGETALFELPGGERLLVDGGSAFEGGFDVGERVVIPFLLGRGVTRLDVLLLAQPRADRQGGLALLARVFPIREVWLPAGTPQVGGELGRVLADRRVPILVKRDSDPPAAFGPVEVSILPGPARLAFRLAFGEIAIVYPPDGPGAPPPATWRPPVAAGATILHWPASPLPPYGVGPLLDAVRPDLVIVPAEPGRRVLRDLPELLDLMEVGGARVFLPERDGAVIVTTDGRTLRVRTAGSPQPADDGL